MLLNESTRIRTGAFEGFRSLLSEHNVDPNVIFSELELEEEALQQPDSLIPVTTYRRALNLAAEYANQPNFGLLMSQRQTLHKFGAVGYLMLHANTVGDSIKCLDRYLRIHDAGSNARLDTNKGVVLWLLGLNVLDGVSTQQHVELGIGLAAKIIRIICSETWKPSAIYFEHTPSKNSGVYEKVFGCPVYFEQAANSLEFPEKLLHTKLPGADPVLYKIIQSHVEGVEKEKGDNFANLVKRFIQENLEDGKPCLAKASRYFGMSASQMQRKLKQEGTAFQDALQDVRHGLACKYLADTDMPLATISMLLAYAEPAVFSRAFRRHFGMSPRDWRRQNMT
jgi:AraC-like DNA-binding protein